MISLLHPALSFLQIQNKVNDNIVLLAPPCPWQHRKCVVAAVATATWFELVKARGNSKRTSGVGDSSSCVPFTALLMMNCIICRHLSALFPLAATEALYSVRNHRHLSQRVTAHSKWRENKQRWGQLVSKHNKQPMGHHETNNLPSRLVLGKGGGGRGGDVGLLFLIIWRCNHGNRNEDQGNGCRCANRRCAKKMEICVMVREGGARLYILTG